MEEQNNSQIVYFECCTNCKSHSWCTRHDQAKYQTIFIDIKNAINKHIPSLQVAYNVIPKNYFPLKKQNNDNRYIDGLTKKSVYFPGLGAFQVYFKNILIFSKYQSDRWPQSMQIVNLLLQVQKEFQTQGNLKKYEMFQLRENNLMRMRQDQQLTPREDRDLDQQADFEYHPLSLAEYERVRSGSKSKKRQFVNRAYNKIFQNVQKQLENKQVRNIQDLYMDQNINISERQYSSNKKYKHDKPQSSQSHKFVFTSQSNTTYSGFTNKTENKANNVIKNMNDRQTYYKEKEKRNSSNTRIYEMKRNSSNKKIGNENNNSQKIKHLKNDIDKLTYSNNKKIANIAIMNSQIPSVIKYSNNYNDVLMKMPQFVKKKQQCLEQRQILMRLDNIDQQNDNYFEEGKQMNNCQRKTPYKIMNQWDRQLQMLETRFQKFQKKVQIMKQKKEQFEEGSNIDQKIAQLMKADRKQSKDQKQIFMFVKKNNQIKDRNIKKSTDYVGISPDQKSQKLRKIYGKGKLTEDTNNKKYYYIKHRNNDDLSNQDNQLYIDDDSSQFQSTNKISFNYGVGIKMKPKLNKNNSQKKLISNTNQNFYKDKRFEDKAKQNNKEPIQFKTIQNNPAYYEIQEKSNSKRNQNRFIKYSSKNLHQQDSRTSNNKNQSKTSSSFNKYSNKNQINKKVDLIQDNNRNSFSNKKLHQSNIKQNKLNNIRNKINEALRDSEQCEYINNYGIEISKQNSQLSKINSEKHQKYNQQTNMNTFMKKIKLSQEDKLKNKFIKESNSLSKNTKQTNISLTKQQTKDNLKNENRGQLNSKYSTNQNQNYNNNNKILASRNSINKLSNKNQQNILVKKDVHRSHTSRNPSGEHKQLLRNNSKNNLSSRSISSNKGTESKISQNTTEINQFKQAKNNSKSKTDNNFYNKKDKKLHQEQYDVAQYSDSCQRSENQNIQQQSQTSQYDKQNNTNQTYNNKSVHKIQKLNKRQQNQKQKLSNKNHRKQNKQLKKDFQKQIQQNSNKQQQSNDQNLEENNKQLSHSVNNDSISPQQLKKLKDKTKSKQHTIHEKDKVDLDSIENNIENKDSQNEDDTNKNKKKKKKIRVKQHKLSTKQVNISITNGSNKNNEQQQILKAQNQQNSDQQSQQQKQNKQIKQLDQNQMNNQNVDQNSNNNQNNKNQQGNSNKINTSQSINKQQHPIKTQKSNHSKPDKTKQNKIQLNNNQQNPTKYQQTQQNCSNKNNQLLSFSQKHHQQKKTIFQLSKEKNKKDNDHIQGQYIQNNKNNNTENESNQLMEQTKNDSLGQNNELQECKQHLQNHNNFDLSNQKSQLDEEKRLKNISEQNKKDTQQQKQVLNQDNHDDLSQNRLNKDVALQFNEEQNIGDQGIHESLKKLNENTISHYVQESNQLNNQEENKNQNIVNGQSHNNIYQQQKQCFVKRNNQIQNQQFKDEFDNQDQQQKQQIDFKQLQTLDKHQKKDDQNIHSKTQQQKQQNKQSKFIHKNTDSKTDQKINKQKENIQNNLDSVQQKVNNTKYQGPTNKQFEQNGQLMVGREVLQKKIFKDTGIQSSFNEASCQTDLISELNNNLTHITNKTSNKFSKNKQQNQGIEIIKQTYERKLDMKRANILNNLYYSTNDIFKIYPKIVDQNIGKQYQDHEYTSDIALKRLEQCEWKSLKNIYKFQTLFPEQKKWNLNYLTIDDKKNTALGSVLKVLITRKTHLITRLFENNTVSPNGLYGIWLCHNSAWTPVIIDDYVPVLQGTEIPAFLNTQSKYIWPLLLQKAISKLCGGYMQFNQLLIPDIFKMLTGSNFVTFKIKQDPSMNSKAIRYVSENENKNFILHCQKHKKQVPKNALVKLPQVLTIQSTQSIDKKDLIQLQIDQNQPFWMKFQIFCQSFKCINLLHLRQNYLFTHIPVILYPSSYTVVQLVVQGITSSNISLNHLGDDDQLPKITRVILYRQQQKSILKLVGQAKEKNKKLIFFDCQLRKGRYFLFVEGQKNYSNAIISYSGDEKAYMKVIQNIENITMKNKNNQYIPVSRENKIRQKQKQAPKYLNTIFDINVSHRGSDNNSQKFERLKNQFLEYLANEK